MSPTHEPATDTSELAIRQARLDHAANRLRALVVFCVICAIVSLAVASVIAPKVLEVSADVDVNARKIETNTKRAEAARDRAETVERHSRRRFVLNRRAARSSSRVARRAVRNTERVVTVLRTRGIPVPGLEGGSGSMGATGATGATGGQGAQGIPGASVTDSQIDAAVARHCTANVCGLPPSDEQVAAAIRSCAAAGLCRGADGRPPTPDEIDAAVARHCAPLNNCVGGTGQDGRPGADGAPAPPAAPATISFVDATGATHRCTIDFTIGPQIDQPCDPPPPPPASR